VAHPLILGVLVGLGAAVLVSALEFWMLGYTINTNSALGPLLLLAAIPLVFILSGDIGTAYLRRQYGNTIGLGKILLGTLPIVIVFTILWGFFLLLLALLYSCGAGTC